MKTFGKIGLGALALALLFSEAASAVSTAVNISTRLVVGTGNNVGIAGFIVTGTGQKKFCLRAIGPTLPVPGPLANPVIALHDSAGAVIATNDDWRIGQPGQQDQVIATGIAPTNDKESALVVNLGQGAYTVVVSGANNTTGIALIEVFDLESTKTSARLLNISTRGQVLTGDNVMIGGFIVAGQSPKRSIVRVGGASLTSQITGAIQDPNLTLHDANGAVISFNDNWKTSQEAEINASSLAPLDTREPAIITNLPPGAYSAVVAGTNNSTGIALVEFFDLDQPPQADGSTLYTADLRPQATATSQGYGTASLRLSADGTSASVAFQYSNLTGPITGMHIHGPGGQILFDVDQATPQADGTYLWTIVPAGTLSVTDILNAIQTGQVYYNIHTALYPKGEITGYFHVASGGQAAPTPTPPPPLASGTPTAQDAARFLSQSSFGPNTQLLNQVQQQGFTTYLNQQFGAAVSSHVRYVDLHGDPNDDFTGAFFDAWWTYAIAGQDQLRQRVAFALSEIFVVSAEKDGRDDLMSTYMDVLVRDAFGNFRQLLEDITLNPGMGEYLDMLQNNRSYPDSGTHPNENYAREIMQLFSIGLYRLNLDGGLTLSSEGFPIPTYDQDAVTGLAAVFTGWSWAGANDFWDYAPNWRQPMVIYPDHHQPGPKTILNGVVIPDGQTPQQELKIALDTIFNHPNVGPFICRQLIQRLVTSNPSPAYVYRVASVFNNNGQGVRGDLRAVVKAILMDYDARGAAKTDPGSGHLREPLVRLTNLLRAFHAASSDGTYSIWMYDEFGQRPLDAPSVFNFFSPDYEAPGAIAQAGLRTPELQITTETTVVGQTNRLLYAMWDSDNYPLDFTSEVSLASNPTALVDHLNQLLMAGGMSPEFHSLLVNTISQISSSDPEGRAFTAIYLVINNPDTVLDN